MDRRESRAQRPGHPPSGSSQRGRWWELRVIATDFLNIKFYKSDVTKVESLMRRLSRHVRLATGPRE
jgi:hypothetical protein